MKRLSQGEEMLDLHLRANHIEFQREVCLIPGRKWRVDFLLESCLIVEVEGGSWQIGRHQRGAGFAADCAKYNALTLAGFAVLRFTTSMVASGMAIETIMQIAGSQDKFPGCLLSGQKGRAAAPIGRPGRCTQHSGK